jgi:uncharacterized membrane protein YesL
MNWNVKKIKEVLGIVIPAIMAIFELVEKWKQEEKQLNS